LLDGLDEVLDVNMRQFVAQQVQGLMRQWTPNGNRFALTSRIVGYREAPLPGDLPHVTVVDFGRDEIKLFADKWGFAYERFLLGDDNTSIVAERQANKETRELLDDIYSNPSLERLAASPLMLTMLALLRRNVGRLPDRRIELYDRYTRTLIDNWELSRSAGARQQAPLRFDPHEAISHLIQLALWLQTNKPSGTARYNEIQQVLVDICLRFEGVSSENISPKAEAEAGKRATNFLKDMRHFAGLLVERGRDAFGFLHLTFQEYFVGRSLARMSPEERWQSLKPVLHDPRWREPILLCAGQLGVSEDRSDLASSLVNDVLNAGSPHEAILHRDVFLVADIAAENVRVSNEVLGKIYTQLSRLTSHQTPVIAQKAWEGMAKLAGLGYSTALNHFQTLIESGKPYPAHGLTRLVTTQEGSPLCSTLMDQLANRNAMVIARSLEALGLAGIQDARVLRAALEGLKSTSFDLQREAKQILAASSITNETIRDALLTRLTDEDDNVRGAAVRALASVVATDETVRDALLARLADEDRFVRFFAAHALASVVATDETVRDALLARLADEDEDSYVRGAAVRALASVVATEETVRDALLARLADEDDNVRGAAAEALAGVVATEETVRDALLARLADEDENSYVRGAAAEALAGVVVIDEDTRFRLLNLLADKDWKVRITCASILMQVLVNNRQLQLELIRWIGAIDRGDSYRTPGSLSEGQFSGARKLRHSLAKVFGPFLAENVDVLASVLQALTSESWAARQGAIWTLAAMPDNVPDELIPKIEAALEDDRGEESWMTRITIARGLMNYLDRDIEVQAVNVLINALDYGTEPWYEEEVSQSVRERAIEYLSELDPIYQNEALLERLQQVLDKDRSPEVRDAAYRALLKLANAPKAQSDRHEIE
jgi:HEAT repeat protein